MTQRYSLVCDDQLAARVDAIAQEYGLTETEVLHQLVTIGLERRETVAR
ncbi:CopG family transcriptional regulator [Halalkalicoccus sp. NIPERK01]|nr:CopG family transcriptional regulator [Halalkalicoccus sp. NIPERK01]MDL5362419.1 CopG family transcriptional regulator [Halalkalicoccus sp. NIPERK01]